MPGGHTFLPHCGAVLLQSRRIVRWSAPPSNALPKEIHVAASSAPPVRTLCIAPASLVQATDRLALGQCRPDVHDDATCHLPKVNGSKSRDVQAARMTTLKWFVLMSSVTGLEHGRQMSSKRPSTMPRWMCSSFSSSSSPTIPAEEEEEVVDAASGDVLLVLVLGLFLGVTICLKCLS